MFSFSLWYNSRL